MFLVVLPLNPSEVTTPPNPNQPPKIPKPPGRFQSVAKLEVPASLGCFVRMAQQAMPLLALNLSGEMVYILAHRLQAQNIAIDKQQRGTRKKRGGKELEDSLLLASVERHVACPV